MDAPLPGRHNAITDVAGVLVGHVTRDEPGWLTGVTVVVPPPGTVGGVEVRGGAPGTRETDLLDPTCLVDRVDAVVLAGGSAFGLACADGALQGAYAAGLGWCVGEPHEVVPVVPAAAVFDLGRGGAFGRHPDAADGRAAYVGAT
ncbi:P1 family peptidase, partial [Knoellia aerolata]